MDDGSSATFTCVSRQLRHNNENFYLENSETPFPHPLLLLAGMGFATATQATLVSRLGGQAVYDTDLKITWLANANANGPMNWGLMNWNAANTWAASLNVGGYTGWRLPTAKNADGSGPSFGYVSGSELGHLFYNELGGVAGQSILTTHNANFNLFSNIQGSVYWSGTEYAPIRTVAWYFNTNSGSQYYNALKDFGYYAWAVRSGDVAAVPEPEEYMMMLLGFGMVGWQIKRRQRKAQASH